jgi:monofunctional biosynthetic peptidoglycan transglycosylase
MKTHKDNFSQFGQIPIKTLIVFGCVLVLGVLYLLTPPVWQMKQGPVTVTRWPKSGKKEVAVGPNMPGWTPINNVSRHVLNAIIVAEDDRFYSHWGFDFKEIMVSLRTNLKEKRYVRGGSTITQQVVKKSFLSSEKSLYRKAREALGSLTLEFIMDKDEILEWYINLIEFGDGVYGISEAALHYFDTKPELLTIQQGANLAVVIPSPNGWSVGLRQGQLTQFGQERYFQIIDRMYKSRLITADLYRSALATGDFGRPIRLKNGPKVDSGY